MNLTPPNNKKRQDEFIESIIIFVYEHLCKWSDISIRPNTESEKKLNSDLSDFLTVHARNEEFPFNFHHEGPQGNKHTVDISVYPNNIECYREIITVFECKRLSAETGKKRKDEYVTGHEEISGGIQRFKLEVHGEKHRIVGMIGYIQTGTCLDWQKTINNCIDSLCSKPDKDNLCWNKYEHLNIIEYDEKNNKYHGKSLHPRITNTDITVHHLWVNMHR